jgi:predicted nucleotidyltransferase
MMRGVFRRHTAIAEVRLFGSRAKGTHSFRSDVDLALFGAIAPLEGQAVAAELDDLPLPYKYDVQVFDAIQSKPLREHIHRVGLTLYFDVAPQFQSSEGESTDAVEVLFQDLTHGRKDFWDMMRDTSSEQLRALIVMALNEANGSYRDAATRFHIAAEDYRRFTDVLMRRDCIVDSAPFKRMATPQRDREPLDNPKMAI